MALNPIPDEFRYLKKLESLNFLKESEKMAAVYWKVEFSKIKRNIPVEATVSFQWINSR